MRKFTITRYYKGVEVYGVQAETKEEALEKYDNGEADLYEDEVIEQLGNVFVEILSYE